MTQKKKLKKKKKLGVRNYGLDWAKQEADRKPDQDWKLGASSPKCIAEIPAGQRGQYMPAGERQNIGEEKMDCASRDFANICEAKFNYLVRNNLIPESHEIWLAENGYFTETGIEFSDAYIAILSGTTRSGNSLVAPIDAGRHFGLIPKTMLPQGNTFDEHHDPKRITQQIKDLGEEFLRRFGINREEVSENQFSNFLERDMLAVGGFAWPQPVNGEYPRVSYQPNHAFVIFEKPDYLAFDNYEEAENDFIKKLAPDYDFLGYGYRIILSVRHPMPKKLTWWELVQRFFRGRNVV